MTNQYLKKNQHRIAKNPVQKMEDLLIRSQKVEHYQEREIVESQSNNIVLDALKDYNNGVYEAREIVKILNLHKEIIFMHNTPGLK